MAYSGRIASAAYRSGLSVAGWAGVISSSPLGGTPDLNNMSAASDWDTWSNVRPEEDIQCATGENPLPLNSTRRARRELGAQGSSWFVGTPLYPWCPAGCRIACCERLRRAGEPRCVRVEPPNGRRAARPSHACPPALVWACVIGDDLFCRVQYHVRSIQEWEPLRAGRGDA